KKLDDRTIAHFRETLAGFGYTFQFITLAGFHALNHSFFELARDFHARGMSAYAQFQAMEFASEAAGYTATRHQREVGTGYFDAVARVIGEGQSSTTALAGSTEAEQFYDGRAVVSV
ncbi:MAG: isocitrate lyase, partial [Vulcanimicrobiaceae bacterium]